MTTPLTTGDTTKGEVPPEWRTPHKGTGVYEVTTPSLEDVNRDLDDRLTAARERVELAAAKHRTDTRTGHLQVEKPREWKRIRLPEDWQRHAFGKQLQLGAVAWRVDSVTKRSIRVTAPPSVEAVGVTEGDVLQALGVMFQVIKVGAGRMTLAPVVEG